MTCSYGARRAKGTPAQPRELRRLSLPSLPPDFAAAGFVIRRTRAGLQIPPQQERATMPAVRPVPKASGATQQSRTLQSSAVVRTPAQPCERASPLLPLAAAGFVIRRTRAGLQIPPQQNAPAINSPRAVRGLLATIRAAQWYGRQPRHVSGPHPCFASLPPDL